MFKRAMGAYLLGVATQGWALSLGASSGAVTIGQPLDVQVRTSADAAEWASGLCVQAEVFFGETRLPSASVDLVPLPGQGEGGAIRLRSRVVVNEPIVTVVLSAGCADKFSRRYVFLSDFEPAAPVANPSVLPAASAIAAVSTEAAPSVASPALSVISSAQGAAVEAPPSPKPTAPRSAAAQTAAPPANKVASAKPAATPRPAPKPAATAPVAPAGPRLKLEPVDLSPARVGQPGLKAQSELISEPTVDDARRVGARDEWAALNASPTELAAQREKVTVLEKQLEQVREEQQRMQASIESMNAQWREAQEQRYQNPLVYGLALSLLVALGLWWRARRSASVALAQGAWWESTQSPVASASPSVFPGQDADVKAPDSLLEASDSVMAAGLHAVEHPLGGGNGLSAPVAQAVTPASIDQLLDMVQQVDFFESLGQFFDAQRTLKDFVSTHPASCELPYLLWLRHANEMGDAAQHQQAAKTYQEHFLAPPPSSSVYGRYAPGLEADTTYLTELSKLWDTPEALPFLERALLSSPHTDGPLQVRTLETFEDLFTLYAVAQALHLEASTESSTQQMSAHNAPADGAAAVAFPPTAAMDLAWQPAPEIPVRTAQLIDFDLSGLSIPQASTPFAAPMASTGSADQAEKPTAPSLNFDFDLDAVTSKTPLDKPPA